MDRELPIHACHRSRRVAPSNDEASGEAGLAKWNSRRVDKSLCDADNAHCFLRIASCVSPRFGLPSGTSRRTQSTGKLFAPSLTELSKTTRTVHYVGSGKSSESRRQLYWVVMLSTMPHTHLKAFAVELSNSTKS